MRKNTDPFPTQLPTQSAAAAGAPGQNKAAAFSLSLSRPLFSSPLLLARLGPAGLGFVWPWLVRGGVSLHPEQLGFHPPPPPPPGGPGAPLHPACRPDGSGFLLGLLSRARVASDTQCGDK